VWLTLPMGDRAHLLILIAAALGVLVGCFVGGSPARRVIAGLLTTAVVLLTTNAPAPLWFSMLLMTTMFVGTVLCRYGKGEVSGRAAAAVYGGALAVIVAVHVLRVSPQLLPIAGAGNAHVTRIHPEIPTFLAAYLVFGAGLLARRCRFPRILIWFGTISYSLYLMHAVVMYHVPWWGADKALTMIRWVALSIAVSALTYYIVEKPGIALGHRVADRLGPTRRRAEQSSYATAG
jgi:peptidoglycan/LPS O-acetylase OafA/YrhL